MILYKYVSFEAAQKILSSQRISFTHSHQFNDPHEMHAISNFRHIANDSNPTVTMLETDFSLLQLGLQRYGVLSLTRNPLNNLMWSHYADEHRGIVIGLDVEEAGFCSKSTNVVPANLGEIIYTKTFPDYLNQEKYKYKFNSLRSVSSYSQETSEFFKYAYLYKGLEWSYEEEIRVVKSVGFPSYDSNNDSNNYYTNTNGDWYHRRLKDNKDLNLYKFPLSAIKEIYFGMSMSGVKNHNSILDCLGEDIVVKKCCLSLNSYEVIAKNWF